MASTQDQSRIVLIGRTGNGKSSTGNSLLDSRSAFDSAAGAGSVTRKCQMETGSCVDINGRQKSIMVVDTPGFFDTDSSITNEAVERTIASQIFDMTSPGVHAFLIVTRIGRFTPEEKKTVDLIKKIFGAGAAKYCILIFTSEDQLDEGQTLDEFISTSSHLQELVSMCGNRKMGINNKLSGQPLVNKKKKLLQMIDEMVATNNSTYYTNAQYQQIERKRAEEKQKREQEEVARKKKEDDELRAKIRAEEQQKAARSSQCSHGGSYDHREVAAMLHAMQLNGCASPIDGGMRPMPQQMRTGSSTSFSTNGGRFTGDYVASRGAANGRPIYEGARGGQFHITPSGNKSYLPK